ncbi:hypothetical protein F511_17266 [Dorcoceras hygrometricum]|uniref:Uncharacterized protein n=1 Tax=Dorcoceras hygrometricum TaxID=472368 RepID=A0A2Z7CYH4_9LAMI|nr:hypothetical protein F511_17266 [Dorcoceras hygrometricum]
MASSFYSNAQHVDFESVLSMDDHGMVSMFEALMDSVGGSRSDPPARQRKNNEKPGDDQYEKSDNSIIFIHRVFKDELPCWHLCLAPTGITRIRLFSVDCGSLRQSGPRPEPRLLCQAALEALTRSARTNTPRKTRPEQFPVKIVGGGGGARAAVAAA